MKYDVVIIGGGLSGLTAGSLLAKSGLHIVVIDKSYNPGGSCGIFKRDNVIFDQGAAMLYGFGEKGFNPHRFVFNCLEEPIDMIKHDLLYCVNFKGHRIKFWPDIDKFTEELAQVFPTQRENIKRFYHDMLQLYQHVMVENPSYSTPDETDSRESLAGMLKHPLSYLKFFSYLNRSVEDILKKYFTDPEIFKFFDKLTSTYCYTTVKESPAILAAVMFIDNHIGGSYYPAGSTINLPGKLEKVIEENNGYMLLKTEVVKILFQDNKPYAVALKNGDIIQADNFIYSGTVWNLYGKLIDKLNTSSKKIAWAKKQIPTYPSVVLYAYIDKQVIPDDTAPLEMLIGNPDKLDESEVTAYIPSIDDNTLCPEDGHVVMAIGPTFENWKCETQLAFIKIKNIERERLLAILEKRFPGFQSAVRFAEIASPLTIERYTNKNGGAVAGPKQMLGQHLFNRLHTKSEWNNLFYCGESTVMGTGTPAVTTSGLSAANAILKKLGLLGYHYQKSMKNYVRIVEKPYTEEMKYVKINKADAKIIYQASACQYCQNPLCSKNINLDIRGIMRRSTVGNFTGAKKLVTKYMEETGLQKLSLKNCEQRCIQNVKHGKPVQIESVVDYLLDL